MLLYRCPRCGATYAHDEAVNHAVYYCPRRTERPVCTGPQKGPP